MQSFSRSIIGFFRRRSVGIVGSTPLRWWPPSLARPDASPMDRISRKQKLNKLHSCIPLACTTTNKCIDDAKKVISMVTDNNPTVADDTDVCFTSIISKSTHRDGAIYNHKGIMQWFDVDISDRNETSSEMGMFAEYNFCPCEKLQFYSLTLADCSVINDPIQLYGYIAARDDRDHMLNYVLNHSRDDPIIVHKGSLIQMTGPKRCIEMVSSVLLEFDMRIKNGEQEVDDLQLIDGAIVCSSINFRPVKQRIKGTCGSVDLSFSCISNAMDATIEVLISKVHRSFILSLGSFVYVDGNFKEIQLFRGTIDRSCGLRRFAVAVSSETVMVLNFRFDDFSMVHHCSFKAQLSGCARRRIKHNLAKILVRVTWSSVSSP